MRLRHILIAVACAIFAPAALVTAADTSPTAVIGMIDAGTITKSRNITVESVGSTKAPTGFGHGDYVVTAFSNGYRPKKTEPVHILYASPFEVDPEAKNPNEVLLDWETIYKALHAMRAKGATVVCTSFHTDDKAGAMKMVEIAQSLGITIVASLGNGQTDAPYPAMLPGTVAVLAREAAVSKTVAARADYVISGDLGEVRGTSYATAEICGRLARQAEPANVRYAAR